MELDRLEVGFVYRYGPATIKNLTPRLDVDTVGRPGQAPGLSTFCDIELSRTRKKAQKIDVLRLDAPLGALADDPTKEGGTAGHVAIVPLVEPTHEIDVEKLVEWASGRERNVMHPLCELILQAVVEELHWGPE